VSRVDIAYSGVDEPAWSKNLGAFAKKALRAAGIRGWSLSILLCDDATIKDLNARFRGRDEATDVLSFSQFEGSDCPAPRRLPFARVRPGDVAISLDTLRVNAEYFGVEAEEELKRLVVHGILHLSGMDHGDNDPSQPMLARQEDILARLSEERIF
jgi:probable rRNA maturation factor